MTRRPLLLALALLGCSTPAVVIPADDASTSPDVPVAPDVLDAPTSPDVPIAADVLDAPTSLDVPAVLDAPDVLDAPAMDAPAVPDASTPDRPAMTSECGVVTIPPADPDAWTMALPSIGAPTVRMVTTGSHRDVYLRGPGSVAEIAVRLDWGGTVVFFGQAGVAASNTIDANDTGRELQLAIYDPTRAFQGCAHNASCAGTNPCGNSITFLGWNPVQGGDECNRGARVLRSELVGDRYVVAVRPLQWNPDWSAMDCRRSACGAAGTEVAVTYTLGFRFVHTNVVEVDMEVASEESFSHPPTEQEFPTLYVGNGANGSTDLPLLLASDGTPVTIDQPANDGFTYRNFTSPAGWVTWQHAVRDYGIGLAMDHLGADFQAWAGSGSGAPYFHNVRPRQRFGLSAGGAVRGRALLALGSEVTVRALMTTLASRRAPFGVLDAPAGGTEVLAAADNTVRLAGWALDNAALDSVRVRLDGRDAATLARAVDRPDVCAVYPNYPGCTRVGFEGTVALGIPDGCLHVLTVIARDRDGNETELGRRAVRSR